MGLTFAGDDDAQHPVFMGSYGIGVTRVMGVIAEKYADEKGLVWPEAIAPYKVYLVSIGNVNDRADDLYDTLTAHGVTVLYDDRNERPGTKFADAELIGLPYRLTISERLIEEGKLELTHRKSGDTELLTLDELLGKIN